MKTTNLLASSSSQEGILKLITQFYCGEEKDLKPIDCQYGSFSVHFKTTGKPVKGVEVEMRRGRYRFISC